MMPFEICGLCGCDLGGDELFEVVERRAGFLAYFSCHCGGVTAVAASPSTFIEWVNLNGAMFADYLDDMSPEDVFEFWEGQTMVDPASIPVEV